MTEKSFNLLHNFEHRRDAYGFALRPQHVQRYRECANIYKEEEEERSDKWKTFLEQQAKSDQSCSSDEEGSEIVPDETTKVKEETVSQRASDVKYGEIVVAETAELKEETVSQRGSEGDDSSEMKADCDGSTQCDQAIEVQFSEKHKEKVQLSEEPKEEVQLSEEPKEEVQLSEEHREEVQLSEEPREEEQLSEEPKEETQLSEGHKEKVQLSEKRKDKLQLSEESKKKVLSSEELKKGVQLLAEPQQEERLSKQTKASEVETWSSIRPSLRALENVMSLRIKNTKDMKGIQRTVNGDHLSSIKETGPLGGDSEEEDVEDEACVEKTSDDNVSASRGESTVNNEASPNLFFPWKELEFLVRGGVPKYLRGEVWQAFVGVKARRVERYYEELLTEETSVDEGKDSNDSAGVPQKWKRQIEKDIPRTFPGHPALDEHGRDSLRRLLLAYARHNPSVGYCQAMNFFAGLLLLLMPEENAFWTFVGIMDDYFEGYYTEEMIESQVDQLVFEVLMRERFPKLVNHLDYLGVQVAWISGPWFLSIFVNMLPWESVLRVWDVLLFEGNRVMLFRTALALMDLYGPALVTTKDAGDAITLLQSLAGSTFDSSQLVLTACMGFLAVTEARLQELREKHRPTVLEVVEERSRKGRVWKDSKGLASKLYSFKHDPGSLLEEKMTSKGHKSQSETDSSNLDDLLGGLNIDSELDSLPDLQEQVVWMKVELCRLLEEKRSAILRAEELETALMEMVKQDNRRQLSAKIEQLEQEVIDLQQTLSDKKEQETAMLQVLLRVEQEQRITEEARLSAEQDAAAQRYAVNVLQEKYEKAMASIAQMEERVVMAESMLEATLQYQSGQARALSSPRAARNPSPLLDSPRRRMGIFSLGWRDKNKGKPANEESIDNISSNEEKDPSAVRKDSSN